MTAITERPSVKSPRPRRTIGFVTACSIVIANIIGTGIFTSLGFQLADIQAGFPLLTLWIIGGVAALCGALCYGELSAALPRSGGEYHFLSQIYHPALGFMAGFVSATVGFAAPIALAAMAFGKYFVGVFGIGSPVLLSFVVVWAVAAFHLGNLQVGSTFHNLSTLVKLLLIGALIGAGLFLHPKQSISFLPAPGDTITILGAPFAVALVYVMYSYSGWNAAAYITGEIKQPEKNVPRSLLVGTCVVIVVYVLLNAIFLVTTPVQELKGQLEVALIAGKHIFGVNGGRVAGAVICLGLISAISSMTWIGPRVSMSMGEDHWLLRLLGRKNPHGIPANAIVLQLLIVNLLLLTRSFESVVQYTQFSLLLCSLFTVVGVIVLRTTRPKIARPYRVWAYPMPPIIFTGITLWMMFYLLHSKTIESLAGLATALVGLLLYFCARKRSRTKKKLRLFLTIVLAIATARSVSAQENPEIAPRAVPVNVGPNDVAHFLAGMPVPDNSPLAPLTRDPAWQEHAAFFEKEFSKLTLGQLQKLHAWQETYLPESLQPTPVAFYMFSGPDFLYLDQFFPKASVYVLCGKESMGPPPDPLRIASLGGALGNLENAMKSSLETTYFITKDMKVDLQQQNLNGVLPILYAYIARADKSITNVTVGSLNSGGGFQEGTRGSIPGVRIRYTDNHSGDSQTLYYFTTDISDGGVKATPGFLKFCERLGTGSSFLKSSSYLMFESGFTTIRNFILAHSNRIVQDDSGIPLAYFDPNKWSLRFFGVYLGPIELFKQHFQPRLQELFTQGSPPPIEFGFGYRWNYKEANLMVAERK